MTIIPKIASNATNDIIEDNLPKVLVEAVIKKRDTFQETVPHNSTLLDRATPSSVDLKHQLYLKMKRYFNINSIKPKRLLVEEPVSDVNQVIPKDDSPELIEELQNVDKHVTMVYDHERMEATLRDMICNSQVKDNDLLVQQYKQFTILEEESIKSGFARFNTIITSLKALDEGFSSKNYVKKFLRDLHSKWRAKVKAIKESKDLSSLALDKLIDNLKVHDVVTKKDSKIYKGKKGKGKVHCLDS
ncbi:hypothetical protein Tco_0456630 [Tanacetum coccineum]